jgi:hypothetical protein
MVLVTHQLVTATVPATQCWVTVMLTQQLVPGRVTVQVTGMVTQQLVTGRVTYLLVPARVMVTR